MEPLEKQAAIAFIFMAMIAPVILFYVSKPMRGFLKANKNDRWRMLWISAQRKLQILAVLALFGFLVILLFLI